MKPQLPSARRSGQRLAPLLEQLGNGGREQCSVSVRAHSPRISCSTRPPDDTVDQLLMGTRERYQWGRWRYSSERADGAWHASVLTGHSPSPRSPFRRRDGERPRDSSRSYWGDWARCVVRKCLGRWHIGRMCMRPQTTPHSFSSSSGQAWCTGSVCGGTSPSHQHRWPCLAPMPDESARP